MGFQIVFKTDVDVASDNLIDTGAKETGQIRYENGNQYTIFKAGASIDIKATVRISAYSGGEISVVETGNNEDGVGVAVATAASGQYFWVQTMGLATAMTNLAVAQYVDIGGMASGYVDDDSLGRKFAKSLASTAGGTEVDIPIWIF